jgi:hypothetical protein
MLDVKRRVLSEKVSLPLGRVFEEPRLLPELVCPQRETRERLSRTDFVKALNTVIPALHPLSVQFWEPILVDIWYLEVILEDALDLPECGIPVCYRLGVRCGFYRRLRPCAFCSDVNTSDEYSLANLWGSA